MPFVNQQDIWVTGTRVYFQRDPIVLTPGAAATPQPIIDLGELKNASPTLTPTDVVLYSSDGGIAKPIAVARTKEEEDYTITSMNLNQDVMALMFDAFPAVDFTQGTAAVTTPHYAIPNCLLKLHDAAGIPVYGVSSVTSVGALVAGTDYVFVNPERGFIKFLEGGAFVAPGTVSVTFVPRAIVTDAGDASNGNRRLINPQTGGCLAAGTALIIWGRCGNQQQTVRECRVIIASQGGNFVDENFSEAKFKLTVLTDPSQPVPAGRLLYWLGSLPIRS